MKFLKIFLLILVVYLILGWFLPILPLYSKCANPDCSSLEFEWKRVKDIFIPESQTKEKTISPIADQIPEVSEPEPVPEPSKPKTAQTLPPKPNPKPPTSILEPSPPPPSDSELALLPNGKVGVSYSAALPFDPDEDPSGGNALSPTVSNGSIPPGLRLEPRYVGSSDEPTTQLDLEKVYLNGTPETAGVYTFTVNYSDTYEVRYRITINS